jgi:endonuclease/exonuclease/phosphatase family metal-dependent hydrolase
VNKLVLASLNTCGGSFDLYNLTLRYKSIAKYFNNSPVDVINFQEVFTYYHLFLLKRLLSGYFFCTYQNSLLGPKGGLVTFSRLALEKTQYITYNRHFVPYLGKSYIEIFTMRGALVTDIKEINVSLVNTHLTAVLDHDWSKTGKYFSELSSEIDQFHQLVHNRTSSGLVVASGDFNIAKATDLYLKLIDYPTVYDPFKKDEIPTRHQEFAAVGKKTNHIDYVFIFDSKRQHKLLANERLFDDKVMLDNQQMGYVSDHVGLQVSLEVK